jgi:hypothetical protein
VVDQLPRRSRRIQVLPPEKEARNNSPHPPLRSHLDLSSAFVPIGLVDIMNTNPLEINSLELEVVTIEDIRS